jgi:predicted Zn-dependent protease with MMP-like domain
MAKRRRGSRHAPPGGARAPQPDAFEAIVQRALDGIPMPFRSALGEVAVVIADDPSPEQRRDNELGPDDTLYGLYEGVPRTEWGADWAAVPNKITIFRLPLEDDFGDTDELEAEIRLTVTHELAHHLGIDDERLDELGVS